MKTKLSTVITEWLLERRIIQTDESELYEYAFFLVLSYCLYLIVSLVIGFLIKLPLESAVFYLAFCLIRNYSGGIHAKTELGCSVATTIVLFLGILTIRLLNMYHLVMVAIYLLLLSAICLIAGSPLDNNNKKLQKHEIDKNHKRSILLISIAIVLFIFFLIIKKQSIAISLSVSAALANTLYLAGKIQRKMIDCKKNSA